MAARTTQADGGACTVSTFEHHNEAIHAWSDARRSGELPGGGSDSGSDGGSGSPGATLIHFDSHADSGLPPYFEGVRSLSGLDLSRRTDIGTFIPIAVLAGLVDRVIWVMPEWGTELEYTSGGGGDGAGSDDEDDDAYEFFVAEDPEGRTFRTNSPLHSVYTSPEEADKYENVRWYNVSVIPFDEEALERLLLQVDEDDDEGGRGGGRGLLSGSFILDVDLDAFSTENPSAATVRADAGLTTDEVQRLYECCCFSEEDIQGREESDEGVESGSGSGSGIGSGVPPTKASCDMVSVGTWSVPRAYADRISSLSPEDLDFAAAWLCRSPVRYSSEDDIAASVDLLLRWAGKLAEKGLSPGAVTVSESASGYLPPSATEAVRRVPTALAEKFGCSTRRIECSRCLDRVDAHNDLKWGVDVYSVDVHTERKVYEGYLPAGTVRSPLVEFANDAFVFVALDGRSYSFVSGWDKVQTVSISALERLPDKDGGKANLRIENDLEEEMAVFWVDANKGGDWYSAPLVSINRVSPGETLRVSTFGGHHFVLKNTAVDDADAEGESRQYHLRVPIDVETYRAAVSQLEDLSGAFVPVDVYFHNDLSDDSFDIYWAGEDDKDQDASASVMTKSGRIAPGGIHKEKTYSGHAFVLEKDEGGNGERVVFRVPVVTGEGGRKRIDLSSLFRSSEVVESCTAREWLARNNNGDDEARVSKAAPRYLQYEIETEYVGRDGVLRKHKVPVKRYTGDSTPYSFPPPRPVPLQKTWPDTPPFAPDDFSRSDPTDDKLFYSDPRINYHIDEPAVAALTRYYRNNIPAGSAVLDLCSSWVSHYPLEFPRTMVRISGVGMNAEEMRHNDQLDDYVEVDLNAGFGDGDDDEGPQPQPRLPYPDGTFDVVTCVVSIDYLVRPVEVLREVHRVLRPGGKVIVSQSNRCFPTKAIKMWLRMDDREHLELINGFIGYAGAFKPARAFDITAEGRGGDGFDPMFVVEAAKA